MNIWGYKLRLKKARYLLEEELAKKNRNWRKINQIKNGMQNLRDKIRELKNGRRR